MTLTDDIGKTVRAVQDGKRTALLDWMLVQRMLTRCVIHHVLPSGHMAVSTPAGLRWRHGVRFEIFYKKKGSEVVEPTAILYRPRRGLVSLMR